MSFIDKYSGLVVNCRLTTIGRKMITSGALNYSTWAIGDSEIDYTFSSNAGIDPSEQYILKPLDKNPVLKYPLFSNDGNTSQYNPLGTIVPVETRVRNSATERGFFSGSSGNFMIKSNHSYTIQNKLKIDLNTVTGGTTVQIKQDTGFSFIEEPMIGDYVYVSWINPSDGGSYTSDVVYSNKPNPNLWYQIQSFTGTIASNTLIVTLDRKLPNFNGLGSGNAKVLIYPGGDSIYSFYGSGSTTDYWNPNTLGFNSNCNVANDDVAVWNMNILYTEDFAGKQVGYEPYTNFGSSGYTGFKNYVSQTFDNPSQKSLGVIHYTNNSINNYYGEQLYDNTLVLELPTVIWHKSSGNTMGLTLKCDTLAQNSIAGSGATDLSTTYYNLIDNQSNVVGKCFTNMKLITIEDEELIAAMSYKSNRNWSYPTMTNAGMTSGIAITRPNIFTSTTQKLYVTYLLENSSGYTATNSYGYANALHCQNYVEYVPQLNSNGTLNNNQVPQFALDSSMLKYMADSTTFASSNGVTFNKFKVLYQLVSDASQRPDPTLWLEYDYTSKLNGYPFTNNIIPSSTFTGFIYSFDNNMYNSGVTYNLNTYLPLPTNAQQNVLQFGNEVFFFGNVKTDIEATVYKCKFLITLPFNQFNTSKNPTWTNSGLSVYVSEIGIYDNNQNLVVVGKLSFPFEKKSNQVRLIELSIDF